MPHHIEIRKEPNSCCFAVYGPYKDEQEAKKNLRENGWKYEKYKNGDWIFRRWRAVDGDGCLMTASIRGFDCKPRNKLPHNSKK